MSGRMGAVIQPPETQNVFLCLSIVVGESVCAHYPPGCVKFRGVFAKKWNFVKKLPLPREK